MGTGIHGFVECLDEDDRLWTAAIDIDLLYHGRNYDAFGCLFGMRNFAGFRPLAEGRGLPEDASERVRAQFADWGSDGQSPTWISWAEIKRVDWSEPAERVDERFHEYRRTEDGRPAHRVVRLLNPAVSRAARTPSPGGPGPAGPPPR